MTQRYSLDVLYEALPKREAERYHSTILAAFDLIGDTPQTVTLLDRDGELEVIVDGSDATWMDLVPFKLRKKEQA